MKIAAALSVPLMTSSAVLAAPTTVMTCSNVEIYEAGAFKPANISVTVLATNETPQSYKAIINSNGRSYEEHDVEMRVSHAADTRELKDMTKLLLPGVKWMRVAGARAANIVARANRDDGSGLLLIELLDKKQQVLGKMVEVGWGLGRCH